VLNTLNKVLNVLYLNYSLSYPDKVTEFFAVNAPHLNITNIQKEKELLEILGKDNNFGILLLELNLSDSTILKLIRKIRARGFNIPLIVITDCGKEDFATEALKRGASDYLIKTENFLPQLFNIIETYSTGYKFEQKYLIEQEKELELQKSQKILRELAENAGIVFWIREIDSKKITYISPSYESLSGRNCESFYSDVDSWHELVHPEDLKVFMDKLSNRVESKAEFIHRIITSDGKIKWVKTESYPLKDKKGKITRILGTVQDITQFKESELSLIKISERMNFLISENPVIIYTSSISGDFNTTFISENVYRILGYKAFKFTENPSFWMEQTHPEDINNILSGLPEIFVKEFHVNQSRFLHANGTYRWILNDLKLVKNKDGKPVEIIGSMIDITEQKLAEEKLQESEELFRNFFDNASIGMVITGITGKFFRVNNSFCKMLGYSEEELLSENFPNITHPDDVNLSTNYLNSLISGTSSSSHFEKRYFHKSGSNVWVMINTTLNTNTDGKPLYFITQVEDITQRKKSEEKLREQAALLDITADAITVRDMSDNFVYWNNGAEKLYGYKKEEVLGKNVYTLLYKLPEMILDSKFGNKKNSPEFDYSKHITVINGAWQGELLQTTKDGSEITVDSKWTLMSDSEGKPLSILVVNSDITKRKILEAEYLRTQRLESIGTLASGIAHDLNNVLTPVMMSLEILKMRFNDQKGLNLIEAMNKSTKHGADLVKQLLTFARGMEGKHSLVELGSILAVVKQIISGLLPKNIDIITEIPEGLKTITGDSTQLTQVLMNLLLNARDAMPDGGVIRISVKNIYLDQTFVKMNLEAKPGYYILLSISDTGIGIPKRIIDKIFEPFFTTKVIGKGTGLGLSTTIGVIKSHKGFINVSSKEGKGTEFKIYLPVSDETEYIPATNKGEETFKGNGETILLIEDEDSIAEAASQTLEQYNYHVLKASDGVEGITLYLQNKEKINLVITDIMLPLMDGHQTIKAILKMNPAEKFVVISGHEQPENIQQIGKQVKFISKPFTANTLLSALHEHLHC
jgi:PAS domain S-box-containing protein